MKFDAMDQLQDEKQIGFNLSGEAVPVRMFIAVADKLTDLLKELETSVTGQQGLEWLIADLHTGSANLVMRPYADSSVAANGGSAVIASALEGLAVVEDTSQRPPHFTDQALRRAKSLVNAAKGDANGLAIFGGSGTARRRVAVSKRLVAHVDELIGTAFVALGSLEGLLEAATIHDSIAFSIYDAITSRRVVCKCDRDALDLAIKHFGKRVSVSGEVSYNAQGDATSIKVDAVQAFQTDPLPQARDIRGLFSEYKVDIKEWTRFVRDD